MLKCLIVEDEPIATEILAEYISQTPFLSLSGICNDAISALDWLHERSVDVIFLDINLPKLNGLDFIRTLRKAPKIILTTAHAEHAVEGYDLQVVDYLLKPIEYSRFAKAANKLVQPNKTTSEGPNGTAARPYYFFTVNKRQVKIFLDEILYIESLKDSVQIVTKHRAHNTHYQLGELETLIQSDNLLRIHRSFLAAIDKIESFTATEVEIAGRELPIGRSFKNDVMDKLGRRAKLDEEA